jgi:hypothetical protein
MLIEGERIFVQSAADAGDQRLRPGRVVRLNKKQLAIDLGHGAQGLKKNDDVCVYYTSGKGFVVERAEIDKIVRKGGRPLLIVSETGFSLPAENRLERRYDVERNGLTILVDQLDCPLLDVSAGGFSVLMRVPFEQGKTCEVSLDVDGKRYDGQAKVASVAKIEPETYRCGFACERTSAIHDLSRGLEAMVRPGTAGFWAA